ncbi:MAG: tetratricopeptide repeat protein [Bacteroidota bacterium]
MARVLSAIIFLFFSFNVHCQNLDSLYHLLENLPEGEERVHILQKIGEAYRFTNLDSTLTYAVASGELANKLDYPFGQLKAYKLKGVVAFNRGKVESQIQEWGKALELAETHGFEKEIADLNLNLGMSHSKNGDPAKALELYFDAIRAYEKLGDTIHLAKANNSIGILYRYQFDYEKAEDYAQRTIKILENHKDLPDYAGAFINLGSIYKEQENYKMALEAFQNAYDNFTRLGIGRGQLVALNNIGHTLTATRKYEQAYSTYLEALEINEATVKNVRSKVSSLIGLGSTAYYMNNFEAAILHHKEALALSTGVDKYKMLKTYKALENNYAALQDFETAYTWGKRHKSLQDSLYNLDTQKELEDLRQTFELEKAAQEAAIKTAKEQVNLWRWLSVSLSLGLLALLGFFLAFRQMKKRQVSEELLNTERNLNESQRKNHELEQEKLKRDLDFANQQLSSHSLGMVQKNQILLNLKNKLLAISRTDTPIKRQAVQQVISSIDFSFVQEEDWKAFQSYFDQVHHGFFERLTTNHSNLSSSDLRLCALIKLNLSTKEAATILGISPESVKMARYRLRKKLELDSETSLTEAIMGLK